ncbi:TOM1-like protein 6 [Oryza brachyantha]|uniref:TOM1-like protein 6 n=1 Tax=Oryza brachyantha TaxID=4533 RepID=UPI001AD9A526|nr:TOM1-like protein 6 [Oryza brachyantha]
MAAASSSSPAVRVDKATSELLLGPDWTLNIDICDALNSDHGQAKEVIKALKKRLQHKNSKVQFFALTLLETIMKNCGDHVHSQVAERDILQEMIKIVKKKTDMQLRDKILVLLESWQEAFGENGGRHPQYYWAYAEIKKMGLEFPQRSPDAAPILTPITRPGSLEPYHQPSHGMPVNSSSRLDEAMSSSGPSLSSLDLERMLSTVELLSEMLKAVNPHDRRAVNDEIITELVKQCRSDQKKIVSLVTSLRDEELLGQALDLNDRMQTLLTKHDAIASGSPLPDEEAVVMNEAPAETTSTTVATGAPRAAVAAIVPTNVFDEEDEDEDDEFSQLARRNSKLRSRNAESTSSGVGTSLSTTHDDGITSSASSGASTVSPPVQCNALALPDPPAPVRTAEEQVMSDLLALTVSSNPSPPHTPPTPQAALNQGGFPAANDHPQPSYSNQGLGAAPYSSYVAPWAQPQPQPQTAGVELQQQPPPQSQLPHNSSPYPPPPWASEDTTESNPFIAASVPPHTSTSSSSVNSPPLNLRPLQQSHSFGVPPRNAVSQSPINGSTKQPMSAGARRPSYVSSNKYFDDLFEKNADGSLMKLGTSIGGGASSPYKA